MKSILFILTAFTLSGFTYFNVSWNIDPSYSIKFEGKSAEGTFSGLEGTIQVDPNQIEKSNVSVTVDVATIKTGNETKDKHAKGEDWFDAAKYPRISLKSTSFQKNNNGFILKGKLKMHGVEKMVDIPFVHSQEDDKQVYSGSFKVNREDYGIEGPFMSFMVGDEFEVTFRIPMKEVKS